MYIVVGSGPSGVSAALGLLQRGKSVTMLDAGLSLEKDRQSEVEKLAAVTSERWSESDLRRIKKGMKSDTRGVPLKLLYGSDFHFREVPSHIRFAKSHAGGNISMAKGGLSNVWGASVLPYRQEDTHDWPFAISRLAPHYRSVAELFDLRGERDRLNELFPFFGPHGKPLKCSQQTEALLATMSSASERLRKNGVHFGSSRIAFNLEPRQNSAASDCTYCGLCMYGCPYLFIYSSDTTVSSLALYPNFKYLPGHVVEGVVEVPQGVRVKARILETNLLREFPAERVFLACGAISTTALLLRSLEAFNVSLEMLDSQIFLLPSLMSRTSKPTFNEPLHALNQIFIEIANHELSDRTIHLQVYTFNEVYLDVFKSKLGPLFELCRPLVRQFLDRFVVLQGFFHSDDSARLQIRLNRHQNGEEVAISGDPNLLKSGEIGRVLEFLSTHRKDLGFRGIRPLLNVAEAGRSYHYGGTFPMRNRPKDFETDVLGVPFGLSRVHAVDSTVFPSIAATTITYTAMANAHRIAMEVDS